MSLAQYTPYVLLTFFLSHCYYLSLTTTENLMPIFIFRVVGGLGFFAVYSLLDIHRRWGFFGVSEPPSHLRFQLKNIWVVVLWGLGTFWINSLLGLTMVSPHLADPKNHFSFLKWEFPAWLHVESDTWPEKILWTIFIIYSVDFLRYCGHRIGHTQFFYRTWPFSHGQHHNMFFLNPISTAYSPFIHFATWGGQFPLLFYWGIGLRQEVVWAFAVLNFPNYNQHFGFDPAPWLTRLNHYYFFGALPWIPLYHQYHHIPFVKRGNFGNGTALWDYLFGTLIPESIEHIETGKMPAKVLAKFQNAEQLDRDCHEKLKNRNRLDYNNVYDWSIFNFRYL